MKYRLIFTTFFVAFGASSQLLYLEEEFETKYYPKRILELDRMIKLDSTRMEFYYQRVEMKYKLKQYKECVADYQLILKKFGERRDTYANLGLTYCFLNDSTQAISHLKKALLLDLSVAMNHLNLGFVYLYFNNYKEGIPCLKKALELKPDYAKAYSYLGYAYLVNGDLENSRASCLKSIDLANYNPVCYYNLGIIDYKEARYTDAITDLTHALESYPNLSLNKDLFLFRGKSYEKTGEAEKAKIDLEKAESLSGTN